MDSTRRIEGIAWAIATVAVLVLAICTLMPRVEVSTPLTADPARRERTKLLDEVARSASLRRTRVFLTAWTVGARGEREATVRLEMEVPESERERERALDLVRADVYVIVQTLSREPRLRSASQLTVTTHRSLDGGLRQRNPLVLVELPRAVLDEVPDRVRTPAELWALARERGRVLEPGGAP